MIIFAFGIIIGVISGSAAVEEKQEPKPLDITPGLAIAAYNVLRKYCESQVGCQFGCPFKEKICHESFYEEPGVWPELEESNVQKS